MYIGNKVRLREYRKDDIKLVQSYMNDFSISKLLNPGIPYPHTFSDEEKWFESISSKNDQYNFAIETLEDNKYIGGCGINSIDWKNSIAVIGIFIGDKEYLQKGYGRDSMELLISFIFEQININKIKLQVLSHNQPAIKCYERCGFIKEGILRQEIFRDGKYHDSIIMGFLKSDYFKEATI